MVEVSKDFHETLQQSLEYPHPLLPDARAPSSAFRSETETLIPFISRKVRGSYKAVCCLQEIPSKWGFGLVKAPARQERAGIPLTA